MHQQKFTEMVLFKSAKKKTTETIEIVLHCIFIEENYNVAVIIIVMIIYTSIYYQFIAAATTWRGIEAYITNNICKIFTL